jgi:hypothetical protein
MAPIVIARRNSRPRAKAARSARYPILALDGGGTKGFQTLGVLKGIETMLGAPLCRHFRLIYGTSTGASTAAFLGLGATVDEIVAFYRERIPPVLQVRGPAAKSAALKDFCRRAFGKRDFSDFLTGVGIVCLDWRHEVPVIFKTGGESPGHGRTIAQAVAASCSAYPIFASSPLRLSGLGRAELVDGSYCANNPVLFALADAIADLRQTRARLRVVSIGVGTYADPDYRGLKRLVHLLQSVSVLQKTFGINTESTEHLRRTLFPDVATVRINDYFGRHGLAVDFIESDTRKFARLFRCGRLSFARHEPALRALLA